MTVTVLQAKEPACAWGLAHTLPLTSALFWVCSSASQMRRHCSSVLPVTILSLGFFLVESKVARREPNAVTPWAEL